MKNLIKNVIRSFKKNKISLIGLIFLLFFGLGSFCVMSNTVSNISTQYNSIAQKGNLHDFTASELYEIGNAAYITANPGFEYKVPESGDPTYGPKIDHLNQVTTKLYSLTTIPTRTDTYSYVIPNISSIDVTSEGVTYTVYTRSYHLKLDAELSTGLYKGFAKSSSPYIEFDVKGEPDIVEKGVGSPSVETQVTQTLLNDWSEANQLAFMQNNPLSKDYNYFLKGIDDQTSIIYNLMTTSDTPLSQKLSEYNTELSYRFFKSINVTATKDNVFYKVIKSSPSDQIDKVVLFKDPTGNYGNMLFESTDWAPYNSQVVFYDLNDQIIEPGTKYSFTVPATFEDLVTITPVSYSDMSTWSEDEKFIYSQIMHVRFKRMLSADLSNSNETAETLLKVLAAPSLDRKAYYTEFYKTDSDIYKWYDDYAGINGYMYAWAENIIVSLNGNVVVNWQVPTPLTCTMVNWSSHFSVVNPQHLSATNKHVINVDTFNSFTPYREWYKVTFGSYPKDKDEINQSVVVQWFNTLTNAQFNFWWRPLVDSMNYIIYKNDGTVAKEIKLTKEQWAGVPSDSIVSCGNYYQIIWGCGLSPDFMYPVVDITRPTPNVKTECLTYVNDAGYKSLRLAFFNSPTEDFLVAKFMPSVTTTRQNEIIRELNKWCADNMLFPKEINAVYRASDTSNVLNSSAFRVSYIPGLVSVIELVSIILCTFLGILALVICLIIIKRYVENNRINIGIMRANGIGKMKIALSLFPFALFPALIGGVAAYLIGLFLQMPMLKLFGNYWTLPTPILGFDWISMLVCILLPFLLFGIVTIIATLWVLRTNSVELMKAGSEFKTNGFSKIAKKPFKHFGILTRFRVALAFNSLSRLIVLALMSCLTMTSLVFAMTSFGKLNKSQAINSSQFDYSFNLQLTTPTTAGGTYGVEDWSKYQSGTTLQGLGYTNPDQYIYNVSWNTFGDSASEKNLTKWYSANILDPMELLDGYETAVGSNGNLMLPTMADATGQKQDLQYLMNKTCSKMTLDYVVGLGELSSNPWEIAIALMPANSRNIASDSYSKIVQAAGAEVKAATAKYKEEIAKGTPEAQAIELAGKWFYKNTSILYPDPVNKFTSFFTLNDKGEMIEPFEMSIDTKSWLSGFSAPYVTFLKTIYTDPKLMKEEYRISYGIVPTNWVETNETIKKDELYTYITGRFQNISSRQRPTFDPNHEITIEGIAKNSEFIKLTSSNNQDLNGLLYTTKEDDGYEWVIINAFAAHKYNLGVGSTFEIKMSNMVDRYDRDMHPEQFKDPSAKSDIAKFKVLAISQGTNGEAFYCKQKPANKLLGLPDGKEWNSVHKYMLWQDQYSLLQSATPIQLIDLSGIGAEKGMYPIYEVDQVTGKLSKTREISQFNTNVPVGFNGIYTADTKGRPLVNCLSLYSYSGLYPGSSVFDSAAMENLLSYEHNLSLANYMTGINDPASYEACAKYISTPYAERDVDAYIANAVKPFIKLLRKYYGDTTMVTCICGANDVAASDLIYKNLISTFNLAETSIMSVIIPITIIVVGIISNLIINDSRKMAAMLKALGYSDKKNAMSILALFIPTIVLGLALAIPLTMGIATGYQALIFSNANILIDVTRKWWYYLASIGGIGVVLLATYVVGWASLKKDRLVDQIKR